MSKFFTAEIWLHGLGASLVSALAALGVAWFVLRRTQQDNKRLAREQAALVAAEELAAAALDLVSTMAQSLELPWDSVERRAMQENAVLTWNRIVLVKSPALTDERFASILLRVQGLVHQFERRDTETLPPDGSNIQGVAAAHEQRRAELAELKTQMNYLATCLTAFRKGASWPTEPTPPTTWRAEGFG